MAELTDYSDKLGIDKNRLNQGRMTMAVDVLCNFPGWGIPGWLEQITNGLENKDSEFSLTEWTKENTHHVWVLYLSANMTEAAQAISRDPNLPKGEPIEKIVQFQMGMNISAKLTEQAMTMWMKENRETLDKEIPMFARQAQEFGTEKIAMWARRIIATRKISRSGNYPGGPNVSL